MRTVLVFAAMLASPTCWAAEGYICVTEKATGFHAATMTSEWAGTQFHAAKRYVIVRSSQFKGGWEVKQTGFMVSMAQCKADFNEYGYLSCEGVEDFTMNRRDLRFQSYYRGGYVGSGPGGPMSGAPPAGQQSPDTPVISIGHCTSL